MPHQSKAHFSPNGAPPSIEIGMDVGTWGKSQEQFLWGTELQYVQQQGSKTLAIERQSGGEHCAGNWIATQGLCMANEWTWSFKQPEFNNTFTKKTKKKALHK